MDVERKPSRLIVYIIIRYMFQHYFECAHAFAHLVDVEDDLVADAQRLGVALLSRERQRLLGAVDLARDQPGRFLLDSYYFVN